MSHEKEWRNAKNILCIRLDSLGDVLMTTPAIRALKESRIGRKITLLTSQSGAKVAPLIDEIDQIIEYDPPWMKASQPSLNSEPEFQMIDCLRGANFDAAVIFTTFSQSPLPAALLTFLADIPLRLAYCRENPYYLLTNWLAEVDNFGQSNIRHEVRRQLDLVASIGAETADEALSLQVSPVAAEKVLELLKEMGVDPKRRWAVFHPGATASSRRYPPKGFAAAAEKLALDHRFQVLFTGTKPEVELVESIRADMLADSFSLAGDLNIDEFVALIALAPVLVSNNSAPVHIASAVQTPVVDLYALTNPQHTPWNVPNRTLSQDVPCRFCYKSICPEGHHNCLALISPDSIVDATLELLEQTLTSPEQIAKTQMLNA
jgi:lipopolysaccharide heptosyltransferase II